MNTALLIIPATEEKYNRKMYIADCIKDIKEAGYIPYCFDIYKDYLAITFDDFLQMTLPCCDIVFSYNDFGQDDEIIHKICDSKHIFVYQKLLGGELEKYTHELENILNDVAIKTHIPLDKLRSRSRQREIVDARFIYFRRAREVTRESLRNIGRLVDNRDHATVLHGIKQALSTREVATLYERCYGK